MKLKQRVLLLHVRIVITGQIFLIILSDVTPECRIVCSTCTHTSHMTFPSNLTHTERECGGTWWNNPCKALGRVSGHNRGPMSTLQGRPLYRKSAKKKKCQLCNFNMLWVDHLNSTQCGHCHFPKHSYLHYFTQVSSLYMTEPGPGELKKNRKTMALSPRWL